MARQAGDVVKGWFKFAQRPHEVVRAVARLRIFGGAAEQKRLIVGDNPAAGFGLEVAKVAFQSAQHWRDAYCGKQPDGQLDASLYPRRTTRRASLCRAHRAAPAPRQSHAVRFAADGTAATIARMLETAHCAGDQRVGFEGLFRPKFTEKFFAFRGPIQPHTPFVSPGPTPMPPRFASRAPATSPPR